MSRPEHLHEWHASQICACANVRGHAWHGAATSRVDAAHASSLPTAKRTHPPRMGAPTVRRQGHVNTNTGHGQRASAGSVRGSPALILLGTEDAGSGQRFLRQLALFVLVLLECALLATRLLGRGHRCAHDRCALSLALRCALAPPWALPRHACRRIL